MAPKHTTGQTNYKLNTDMDKTFTNILLIEESNKHSFTTKIPSTPTNSSIGILNKIEQICEQTNISPTDINHIIHNTTITTNTILTTNSAQINLVTTKKYKQILQITRSYVPNNLNN